MTKRSILVSLDFSDATDAVLAEARQLARAYHARIRLFHVGRDSHSTGGMEFELADHVRLIGAQHRAERARLAKYAKNLLREGFQADVSYVEGDPCKALLDEASVVDPAAVVIAAHPHGALHDMFGGIRKSLIRRSAWPVLVVPAARQGSLRSDE